MNKLSSENRTYFMFPRNSINLNCITVHEINVRVDDHLVDRNGKEVVVGWWRRHWVRLAWNHLVKIFHLLVKLLFCHLLVTILYEPWKFMFRLELVVWQVFYLSLRWQQLWCARRRRQKATCHIHARQHTENKAQRTQHYLIYTTWSAQYWSQSPTL